MPLQTVSLRALCLVLSAAVLFGIGAWQHARQGGAPAPALAAIPAPGSLPQSAAWTLQAQGYIPMPVGTPSAHASNLLVMPPSDPAALTAFWFAGDRESAPNVQIAAAQWDRGSGQWTQARYVVNRHVMGQLLGFGIRRLGNPVAWLDGGGRMHLFVVATGWGGWAASRVLHLRQVGSSTGLGDLKFAPERVLPLSWLWNTSYLVRNQPLPLADGGMVLPVHFELGIKHASALRFDADGRYIGVQRLTRRLGMLQPALVAQSPAEWLAFMRVQRLDGQVAVGQSVDGGAHWRNPPDLALNNPDSAVAALALGPSQLLMAHNSAMRGRHDLTLSTSVDGTNWTAANALSRGPVGSEYSYPAMAWVDGQLWVTFTDNRERIAWRRFAPAP